MSVSLSRHRWLGIGLGLGWLSLSLGKVWSAPVDGVQGVHHESWLALVEATVGTLLIASGGVIATASSLGLSSLFIAWNVLPGAVRHELLGGRSCSCLGPVDAPEHAALLVALVLAAGSLRLYRCRAPVTAS